MKVLHLLKRGGVPVAVGAASLFLVPSAFADAPDFSAVTSGVDFSTVVTGVLAVSALIAAVYVAVRGAKMLIGMIRS